MRRHLHTFLVPDDLRVQAEDAKALAAAREHARSAFPRNPPAPWNPDRSRSLIVGLRSRESLKYGQASGMSYGLGLIDRRILSSLIKTKNIIRLDDARPVELQADRQQSS
jgi:hypothetical protein